MTVSEDIPTEVHIKDFSGLVEWDAEKVKQHGITHVTIGSGNVFKDIGFSDEKAKDLLEKADLIIKIQEIIKRNNFKTTTLRLMWCISSQTFSNLKKGKISHFSKRDLEYLLEKIVYLEKTGMTYFSDEYVREKKKVLK